MNWNATIKWIMLVSGGLTCTMFSAAIAPRQALHSTFGETLDGPVAEIVVRNWGALIGLVGVMLICGAFNPAVRRLALIVAGTSKVVFIALVLSLGRQYLDRAGIAVMIDLVAVTLFIGYLLATRRQAVPA